MKREILLLCAFCAFTPAMQAQQDSLRQVDLDGVVVTAARAGEQTPMAYSNLNKQEIKSRSIEGDVPMLLDMMPSVTVSTESGTGTGNSSLRIRGADASRVNVTLDGVPLNDAESQSVFWVNMPDLLSSVGSVQVQRGVGTSTNGTGTFGGAISLQTARPASKPYGEVGATVGMFNTYKYNVATGTGLMDNGFSFDARYSRVLSDGFVDRTGSDDYSFYGSVAWFGRNNSVRLSVIHGSQQTGLHGGVSKDSIDAGNRTYNPAGEYVDNDGNIAYYGNENDNYKQTHYHLTYSHQLSNSWKASATLYYTRGEGYYEQYKANRKLVEYGLPNLNFNGTEVKKSDLVRQKWMDNNLYGIVASAIYSNVRSELTLGAAANYFDADHFGHVIWTKMNDGSIPNNFKYYDNKGKKTDINAFAKYNFNITDKFSVFADLQYRFVRFSMDGIDDNYYEVSTPQKLDTTYTWNFINPKAGVFYKITEMQNAYFSFAMSGREPNRSDLKDALNKGVATPPRDERLYDFELGYNLFGSNYNFNANLFYMLYDNQIVHSGRLNDSYRAIMENVKDSYRMGIELSGGAKFFDKLKFDANLALSQNKIKNFTSLTPYYDNQNDWNPVDDGYKREHYKNTDIAFSPNVVGGVTIGYEPIKNAGISLGGKYVGDQYFDNTMSKERMIDAYFVVNGNVYYRLNFERVGSITFQLFVNNILDTKYSTSAYTNEYTLFADGTRNLETMYFPQAGINVVGRVVFNF